jgi:predicted permease
MSIRSELRYASRSLLREPGFTAIALLTVAIGIGANTAIFSIVNGVLLRPLPYHEPERLVTLREVLPAFAQTYPTLPASPWHFTQWQRRAKSLEGLAAIQTISMTLTGSGEPEQIDAMRVSASLFDVLGVRPALGRGFLPGEDTEGKERVAILGDSLWRRRFNAEAAIIGRTIQLDGQAFTVVGVLPRGFQFPSLSVLELGKIDAGTAEFFVPMAFNKEEMSVLMGRFNYDVVARLRRGVGPERATAELNVIAQQLVNASGEKVELRAKVAPLLDSMVGGSRRGLLVALCAVGAVLLIVCVNLANLMLARAERKGRESAIRTALGASRGRLLRQALMPALLIALVGGAAGIALAAGGLGALVKSAPADIPRLNEVRLDGRVLLFALGITTVTGLLFGLAPAWRTSRADPESALRGGGRTATGGAGGLRLRSALITIEVGLSAMLLVVAALLMNSFFRVMRAEKGFRAPNVLSADVEIPRAKYSKPELCAQFHQRLLAQLASQPGVVSSAMVSALPLEGEVWIDNISVHGDPRGDWEKPTANVRFMSEDYFRTMGIPLRAGRTFNDDDRKRDVAIVSERLAETLWPGQVAVGRQIVDGGKTREVIGVAGDVRVAPNKPPVSMLYRPYWDWPARRMLLVARTAGDPLSIAGGMRAAAHSVDSDVPLTRIRTMQAVLGESVAQQRFQMLLAAVFAATALLLASLGIYGVVSYAVARRTNEVGIRMALGAQAGNVYRMVLWQAMTPILLGLAAGAAGAVAAGSVLAKLLYEVSPRDPATLAGVTLLLCLVGLAACSVPARRATRVDPLDALRYD